MLPKAIPNDQSGPSPCGRCPGESPSGRLRTLVALLRHQLLQEAYVHAREAYPNECCGFLLASGLRRCVNIQDRLHRDDPGLFSRSARNGFTLAAEDQLFLMTSRRGNDPVLAIYHSHIDSGAYFSKADRAGLMNGGQVVYPDLLHLVIDCRADRIGGAKLFGCEGTTFSEVHCFEGAES